MGRPRVHALSSGPRAGSSRREANGHGPWWGRAPRPSTGTTAMRGFGLPDHRADEARTSRRMELVAAFSDALRGTQDEARVMGVLGEILRGLGLNGYVALLGEDRSFLVGRMVAVSAAGAAEMERLLGHALIGARIELAEAPPYRAAVAGAKVERIDAPVWWARLALPRLGRMEADAVARLVEMGDVVLAPIRIGDDVRGVLTVWANNLDDADVAVAEILGRVLGGAFVGRAGALRAH